MKVLNLTIISLVLALTITNVGCWQSYSQGERVGVPYKLSHKGMFCKTWEGTMNLGGANTDGQGSMVPNVWNFTVREQDVAKFTPIFSKAIDSGETLKVSYDQELFPICDSDDGYFVTDITVLNKK